VKGAIYLPANFARTSTENKRSSVLLHELAHVARLDPLVNFIQIVTQALYWFHPLVWVANKNIRAEREKCCDEIAIAQYETTPKEYGSAIVDTLMHEYESRMTVPTLAVAGPVKTLEDRIRTIMKPGKQFHSRPTFKALVITIVLAVVTIPMAVALTERTHDAKDVVVQNNDTTPVSTQYQAALPDGITAELLAVCEYPTEGKQWWQPDGAPFTLPRGVKIEDLIFKTQKKENAFAFLFRYKSRQDHDWQSAADICLHVTIDNLMQDLTYYNRRPEGEQDGLMAKVAIFSEPLDSTTVQVHLAMGSWQMRAIRDINDFDKRNNDLYWYTTGEQIQGTYQKSLEVLHHIEGHQITLTAIDREGHEYDAGYNSGSLGSRMSLNDIEPGPVVGISKDDRLAKFKLESRPYFSVRIGNVSLRPKTDVSPFVQKKNIKRALEEELAKSIQYLDSVISARVHVVIPEQTLFADQPKDTTAAVVLKLKPGYKLSAMNIAAITHLVAGSVEGVTNDAVTVIDSEGRLLSQDSGEMMGNRAGTVADYKERVERNLETKVTEQGVGSSQDQSDPEPARALSDQDRRQIEQLIQAYSRVPFAMDIETIERLFVFKDEQEKQRLITMVTEAEAEFDDSNEQTTDKIYIMAIESFGNDRVNVSALTPFQGRYMLRTTPCVRSEQGWKIGIDIQEMINQGTQARELGPEESMRRELQTKLQMWENAKGETLVTLYEDAKAQARLRVQAMKFAKEKALPMSGRFTEEKLQQELEKIRAKSPENYRREIVAKYRRQLGPEEKYGKLEFRMLYNTASSGRFPRMTKVEEQMERNRFKDKGPFDGAAKRQSYVWLPLRRPGPSGWNLMGAVIEAYEGQQYLLVSNEPNEIMTADGSWGLLAVYSQKDYMDRLAIGLELDQPGSEKLHEITSQNIDRAMAIVLDGQVLSAPTIASAIGKGALITGQFTEQEVRSMTISLQKGMRPRSMDTPSVKTEN
ncbi:MAG: hypothetical protein HQ515_26060, partial [Phycisphaeraceae bacterium]|nr:hypothetical protein [Phycisphaeraceae bacterium]